MYPQSYGTSYPNPSQGTPYMQPPYYAPPTPPSPRIQPKPARNYRIGDAVLSVAAILLSALFIHTVRSGGGIGATLFFWALAAVAGVYAFKQHRPIDIGHITALILAAAVAVSFSLFSPTVVSVCAVLFVGGLGALWIYTAFCRQRVWDRFWLWNTVAALFRPFYAFGSLFGAFRALKPQRIRTVIGVLIGLLLALPLTAIVTILLQSADAAFSELLGHLFSDFSLRFGHFLIDLIIALPLALYFHAMLTDARETTALCAEVNASRMRTLNKMRIAPPSTIYTAVTPVLLLYILFLIVQSGYFFSAFSGLIPDGMTYAECARRGFFELCCVAAINLMLLFAMWRLCRFEKGTPVALRIYGACLALLTLLLIAVGISKMCLYMQLGLTLLRVYTTWFMVLLAILFVLILLRMIVVRLPLMRCVAIAAAAMCAVLMLSDINGMIASYNVSQYQQSHGDTSIQVDYLESLGDAAVPAISELVDDSDPTVAKQAKQALLSYYRKNKEFPNDILTWTFTRERAFRTAKAYYEQVYPSSEAAK